MRVLVADQDATLLAAVAGAFAGHLDIATATDRDRCIALLREREFDVVVACDKLGDYTGLELLSEVAAEWPAILRIFAASPVRLKRLESWLGLFELFSTLVYPIDARRLLPALALARRRLEITTAPSKVRHVVLEEDEVDIEAPSPNTAAAQLDATAAQLNATAAQPNATAGRPSATAPARAQATTAQRTGSPPAAAPSTSSSQRRGGVQKSPPLRKPTVISAAQREAFQRALAKRKAAEAGIAASPGGSGPRDQSTVAAKKQRKTAQHWSAVTTDVTRATQSSGSLSDLARMATVGRPLHQLVVARGHSKRALLFIGGGVLAALAVVASNFERSGARESINRAQVATLVAPPPLFLTPDSASTESAGSADSQQQGLPAPSEAQAPSAPPQPEPVNPDTAPPDPPPPPALERPGPMEPPSSMMPSYESTGESE